jgi:hypothetical protein
MGFADGSDTTVRHNTQVPLSNKITHHAQSKQSTQSYINNKVHTMNTTHKKVNLPLYQSVEAYRFEL